MMLLALAVFVSSASGVYLLLSRDVFRSVVGLTLMGASINVFVFAAGRLPSSIPPIVPEGQLEAWGAADPVPQALVLTAIVIGFALACFSLVLAIALMKATGTEDTDAIALAETESSAEEAAQGRARGEDDGGKGGPA